MAYTVLLFVIWSAKSEEKVATIQEPETTTPRLCRLLSRIWTSTETWSMSVASAQSAQKEPRGALHTFAQKVLKNSLSAQIRPATIAWKKYYDFWIPKGTRSDFGCLLEFWVRHEDLTAFTTRRRRCWMLYQKVRFTQMRQMFW